MFFFNFTSEPYLRSMTIPKVSVVMPVYNTADYLNMAVDSILNQSLKEIEFIIVNDGSTDQSSAILENYAKIDQRVMLINKNNEGSSIARSIALSKASGEFVYFMDSDDILDTGALEQCYTYAKERNLELILFDAISFDNATGLQNQDFNYNKKNLFPLDIMTGLEMISKLLVKGLFRVPPWIHFIRRDLITNHNLDFYPGIINEDELFFSRIYFFAQRCAYLPKLFFQRRIRPNSTMTAKFSFKRASSYFVIIEELKREDTSHSSLLEEIVQKLIKNIANGVAYQASVLSSKERYKVIGWLYKQRLLRTLSIKNFIVLFLPWTTKIKPNSALN